MFEIKDPITYARGVATSIIEANREKRRIVSNFDAARDIASVMEAYGNFTVLYGVATYKLRHLIENYLPPEILNIPGIKKIIIEKDSIAVMHSWGEWKVEKGTIVIDYHPELDLGGEKISLLIVDFKKNLPIRYESNGYQIGRLIILISPSPKIIFLKHC